MRRSWIPILFTILWMTAQGASDSDTLVLSREECESLFLENNSLLIAEKLNISRAEARLAQARLRPNPEITMEDINLWTTRTSTNNPSYFGDELPSIVGNFGKNIQLNIALEQLIETAGKRKLRIRMEEQAIEQAEGHFEETLRGMLAELRYLLTDWQYLDRQTNLYLSHYQTLQSVIRVMEARAAEGIITREDPTRLKIAAFELNKEIHSLQSELRESEKKLKILLHIPPTQPLRISGALYDRNHHPTEIPDNDFLITHAKEHRPDLRQARREEKRLHTIYQYEKSQRTPDLRLKAGYERGGIFHNFIGIGVGIELPLFNRNQGNVSQANTAIIQAEMRSDYLETVIENEVTHTRDRLIRNLRFLADPASDFDEDLDDFYQKYTEQLKARNIHLLKYLDFTSAWLDSKIIRIDTAREVHRSIDHLNFLIGEDLIQ